MQHFLLTFFNLTVPHFLPHNLFFQQHCSMPFYKCMIKLVSVFYVLITTKHFCWLTIFLRVLLNLQGILFFDRMTDEVLDTIRAQLQVSDLPCTLFHLLYHREWHVSLFYIGLNLKRKLTLMSLNGEVRMKHQNLQIVDRVQITYESAK